MAPCITAGTTVEFTNSDDIQHNVFSPSAAAGKFDLGAYGPGAKRSVTLNEPGEVVVLCNIHMEMEARIVVVRDPYFALTAADGTYRIPAVPPGTCLARHTAGQHNGRRRPSRHEHIKLQRPAGQAPGHLDGPVRADVTGGSPGEAAARPRPDLEAAVPGFRGL